VLLRFGHAPYSGGARKMGAVYNIGVEVDGKKPTQRRRRSVESWAGGGRGDESKV